MKQRIISGIETGIAVVICGTFVTMLANALLKFWA